VHALQAPIQLGGNFGGIFDFFDFLASVELSPSNYQASVESCNPLTKQLKNI
jgi:hypothetical protein